MKKKTKIVGLFLMITLLFFAIPGFGKVQASREDDVLVEETISLQPAWS